MKTETTLPFVVFHISQTNAASPLHYEDYRHPLRHFIFTITFFFYYGYTFIVSVYKNKLESPHNLIAKLQ